MKCYECKYSIHSKSKDYQFYCQKFRVHAQDKYSGCLEGDLKNQTNSAK